MTPPNHRATKMTSTHFDDFEIISVCVEREQSTGESLPQDLYDSPSVSTTELDDQLVEVVLSAPEASPPRQEEGFPSRTAPLHGKKGPAQAVSARYSLTTIIRIPSKSCRTCEAFPGSWTCCILHAAVEPRQSSTCLEPIEHDKLASLPNLPSTSTHQTRDPIEKMVIYRSTSRNGRSLSTRPDVASEYIWLD